MLRTLRGARPGGRRLTVSDHRSRAPFFALRLASARAPFRTRGAPLFPPGLLDIAKKVNVPLLRPKNKVTVLLMGNHSAGKSSLVNYYTEEEVMKTGVAIETQGITFVTSGQKQESLQGASTLALYPWLNGIVDREGITPFLSTEVIATRHRLMGLVTLIDTPGLVDGSFEYAFDVNNILPWLADHADLCLVLFDPMGQALVERTMQVVQTIHKKHPSKTKFYLSKADTVPREQDRQKVLIQVTQGLSQRLSNMQFDLPTIYVPQDGAESTVDNTIDDLCKDIQRAVNQKVQHNLSQFKSDCEMLAVKCDETLAADRKQKSDNRSRTAKGLLFFGIAGIFPFIILLLLIGMASKQLAEVPGLAALAPLSVIVDDIVPNEYNMHVLGGCLLATLVAVVIAKFIWRTKPTLTKADIKEIQAMKESIEKTFLVREKQLSSSFLRSVMVGSK